MHRPAIHLRLLALGVIVLGGVLAAPDAAQAARHHLHPAPVASVQQPLSPPPGACGEKPPTATACHAARTVGLPVRHAYSHVGGPPSTMPHVGDEITPTIRTCTASSTHATPTTSAACVAWGPSGPVNVVFLSTGADPHQLLLRPSTHWRPALGSWLVASAASNTTAPGCTAGWRDSTDQVELRLSRTNRRHFKFFHACAPDGSSIEFGEAHTDNFDPGHCGGDHMVDLDQARDAVVTALSGQPGVTIQYRQDHPVTQRYQGGCGGSVVSDGRVAYITISA